MGWICSGPSEAEGVKLIGDDFIVTNRRRLQKAYERHALDGFILKPNQVGTITEALDTHAYAQSNGLLTIPSGRSGGAVGDIVADLALALEAPISKNGAPKSGERLDKINSLLRASSDNPASHLWNLTEVFYPLCSNTLKMHRTVKKFAAISDSLVKNDKIRYN